MVSGRKKPLPGRVAAFVNVLQGLIKSENYIFFFIFLNELSPAMELSRD